MKDKNYNEQSDISTIINSTVIRYNKVNKIGFNWNIYIVYVLKYTYNF